MTDEKAGLSPERPASSKPKNRRFVAIMGGLTVVGLLLLIVLVFFSGFPGPPQGSGDKTQAPPEDVTRSKP
jgi:hypothetical protein